MRENKGITLISLVITIIIMIILAAVVITYGMDTYENMKIVRFVTQMQGIQKKVDNYVEGFDTVNIAYYDEYYDEYYELYDIGRPITRINKTREIYNKVRITDGIIGDFDDFLYFTAEDILDAFDIDNIREGDEFIINFYTREIISLVGEEYKGKTYYTQYNSDLPNSQKLVRKDYMEKEISYNYSVEYFGLNANIIISNISHANTILRYKEENGSGWKIAADHLQTNEQYKIPITKSGTYNVEVYDIDGWSETITIKVETNNEPKLSEELTAIYIDNTVVNTLDIDNGIWYDYTNYLNSSERWAFAKKPDNTVYVWIPRLLYNISNSNIKFLKGNTGIPTDEVTVEVTANSLWRLSDEFGSNSGIWVEVKETDNRYTFRLKNIFSTNFLQGRDIITVI